MFVITTLLLLSELRSAFLKQRVKTEIKYSEKHLKVKDKFRYDLIYQELWKKGHILLRVLTDMGF